MNVSFLGAWRGRIARTVSAAVLLGGVLAVGATPAVASPASLASESLFSDGIFGFSSVSCDLAGTSTFSFSLSGTASGPYPGTFTATGTATIGPADGTTSSFGVDRPVGPTVTLDQSFTITSGSTTISGTQRAVADNAIDQPFGGSCWQFQNVDFGPPAPLQASGHAYQATAKSTYAAVIQTPSGSFSDSGSAFSGLFEFVATGYVPELGGGALYRSAGYGVQFPTSDGVIPLGPAHLSLSPSADTAPVSTVHTLTAVSTDANGAGTPGVTVRFAVSGSVGTTGSCLTDGTGTCQFSYTGPDLPGADAIVAYADADNSGTRDTNEPGAEATVAWVLPTATAGQITGGGQIPNSAGNSKIAFGFTAKSDGSGIKGEGTVVDISPATNIKIRCTDVTNLVVSGTHATLFGDATVNGTATTYRIDVNDYAEPGTGSDTFKIVTASGYSASGTLTGGNIQVH